MIPIPKTKYTEKLCGSVTKENKGEKLISGKKFEERFPKKKKK